VRGCRSDGSNDDAHRKPAVAPNNSHHVLLRV
jgi:hypothetical protein